MLGSRIGILVYVRRPWTDGAVLILYCSSVTLSLRRPLGGLTVRTASMVPVVDSDDHSLPPQTASRTAQLDNVSAGFARTCRAEKLLVVAGSVGLLYFG